jgi:hypothetical protein
MQMADNGKLQELQETCSKVQLRVETAYHKTRTTKTKHRANALNHLSYFLSSPVTFKALMMSTATVWPHRPLVSGIYQTFSPSAVQYATLARNLRHGEGETEEETGDLSCVNRHQLQKDDQRG